MSRLSRLCIILLICVVALSAITVAQDDSTEVTPEPDDTQVEVVITREFAPDESMFRLVQVASGFRDPLYVTGAGDNSGRLFVMEQSGGIWIVQDGVLMNSAFLDLSNIVSQDVLSSYSERGLLGLAFHPNYIENGFFYVNYTDAGGTTHIARYQASLDDINRADPNSAQILLSIPQPFPNHNGGHMAFGPDGYLYISVGDGGLRDDPQAAGQNPATLLGTLLRIDVDNVGDSQNYAIPEDNPFSRDDRFAPEVWAFGLRNVWRFSFDRATGDVYIADVGQDAIEEVNFQPSFSLGGENYGWVAYEGSNRYLGGEPISDVTAPIFEYSHSQGCSITGGYVYRGEAIPDLQGVYFYSDYCSGRLFVGYRTPDLSWESIELLNLQRSISSFGEDDNGELYIIDYNNGNIMMFQPPD